MRANCESNLCGLAVQWLCHYVHKVPVKVQNLGRPICRALDKLSHVETSYSWCIKQIILSEQDIVAISWQLIGLILE